MYCEDIPVARHVRSLYLVVPYRLSLYSRAVATRGRYGGSALLLPLGQRSG